MSTAGRPTFNPAQGGHGRNEKDLSALTTQYSSRDLPSHTKLKYRDLGQGTVEELKSRDFRKDLEERERDVQGKAAPRRPAIEAAAAPPAKKPRVAPSINLDADDPIDVDDSNSESDDDDDDDEEALMAELQRIRRERAADQEKREIQRRKDEEIIRTENILRGNPLLSYAADASKGNKTIRRGWDDDVVFKNCARSEPEKKNVFINDALRSEFHKKFMEKYIM